MTGAPKTTPMRLASAAAFLLIVGVFNLLSTVTVSAALPGGVGAPAATTPLGQRPPDDQPDLRLAVVGDVGTGATDAYAVAASMERAGTSDPFDALVLLGDNVYPDGDPTRLEATVFAPYGPVLDAGAELLAVLGNHDAGFADAQAAALGMPGRWYSRTIGDVLFVALDSTDPENPAQLAWLKTTLDSARARWIVVALHHPPFSAGVHGSDEETRELFVPLFEAHGVDLVLAGHDHDYQRSVAIGGVTYVVSGAGAKVRNTGRAEFTAASAAVLHFVDVAVWEDRIELTAVNPQGAFDHLTITPADAGGPSSTEFAPPENWITDDDTARGIRLAGTGLVIWAAALAIAWLAPQAAIGRLGAALAVASTAAVLSVVSGVVMVTVAVAG